MKNKNVDSCIDDLFTIYCEIKDTEKHIVGFRLIRMIRTYLKELDYSNEIIEKAIKEFFIL